MMNINEENLIDGLKYHAEDHDLTLQPHPIFKDRFQVTYFYIKDHADLMLTIRALIYLCMRHLDPGNDVEKEPDSIEFAYISQALSIAKRLIPMGGETFLDSVNVFLREEGLR